MSAPTRLPIKDRARSADPALFTPPSATSNSNGAANDFDYDRQVVERVDASLWRAVYNGEFRLAVRCRRCGRWLTDGRSKRRHYGATCAAKAGEL